MHNIHMIVIIILYCYNILHRILEMEPCHPNIMPSWLPLPKSRAQTDSWAHPPGTGHPFILEKKSLSI